MRFFFLLLVLLLGLQQTPAAPEPNPGEGETADADMKVSFDSITFEKGDWKIKPSSKFKGIKWRLEKDGAVTYGIYTGQTLVLPPRGCITIETKQVRWGLCSVRVNDNCRLRLFETIAPDGDFSSPKAEQKESALEAKPDGTLVPPTPLRV